MYGERDGWEKRDPYRKRECERERERERVSEREMFWSGRVKTMFFISTYISFSPKNNHYLAYLTFQTSSWGVILFIILCVIPVSLYCDELLTIMLWIRAVG